ncbi:efflux RND transporter periplasmic adaptor subunit [Endozoicomonas lisbonensis]|uniref:HlyD family secretion protein n=1 Tax=Endozoicomonas lisbonensis TaxID=3120522 RepID=A0ABV2SPS7_9GAMM
MLKKRILVVGMAAAIGGGYAWFGSNNQVAEWSFQTAQVDTGRIESVVATAGTLEAVSTVTVGAEISGRIDHIFADYNSVVARGDLLAQIDDRSIVAKLRQAEADLALSEAAVEKSRASLLEQEANYTFRIQEARRLKELTDKGHTTDSEYERALSEQSMAQARIALANAEISRSEAELQKRQAALEEAQLDHERTRIYSPVDGVILERIVEEGQTVNANQSTPELFIIAEDMRRMQIEADVDEADIGQVQEGQSVRFTVDAYPSRTYQGEVEQVRLAATVASSVVTYTTIISVDNQDLSLYPGMTSNVDIIIGQQPSALRVPNSALRFSAPRELQSQQQRQSINLPDELFDSQEQKQKVQTLLASARKEAMAQRREQPVMAGGSQRQRSPRLDRSELEAILGEEKTVEVMRVLRSQHSGRGHSGRGRNGTDIWVLREGEPQRLRIQTGLSDERFTEVLTDSLENGEEIIISARQEQG